MSPEPLGPDSPILLAESSPFYRIELEHLLDKFHFRNITSVTNNDDAINESKSQSFSLILASTNLTGAKGAKLFHSIRDTGINSQTPFIMTYTAEEKKIALSIGASAILEKPTKADNFHPLLENLFSQKLAVKSENEEERRKNLAATAQFAEQGNKLLDEGDLGGAQKAFEEALRIERDSAEVFIGLAKLYAAKEDDINATQALVEARRIEPAAVMRYHHLRQEATFIERGKRHLTKRRFAKAESLFEKSLEINHENLDANIGPVEARLALRESGNAWQAFESAVALKENSRDHAGYNHIGLVATRYKDYEMVHRSFELASSIGPGDPSVHYNRASVYLLQKKFEKSLELLDKSLSIKADFTKAKAMREKVEKRVNERQTTGTS